MRCVRKRCNLDRTNCSDMNRLVIVSNRMPPESGHAAAGGPYVALHATLRQRGGLWLGWSGVVTEVAGNRPHVRESGEIAYAALDLDCQEYAGFCLGFGNSVLWPLCHGLSAVCTYDEAHFATYCEVNRRYGAALLPLLRADDLVWVHDYHRRILPCCAMAVGTCGCASRWQRSSVRSTRAG